MTKRVVLAYSGGLDTSVAIRWMIEEWGGGEWEVFVDVGQDVDGAESFEDIRSRALVAGAIDFVLVDARREMAEEFCAKAIFANARYENKYPLVSALSRPVIVRHLVEQARRFNAQAVAHGCTGKGNDQVRFEVGTHALAPDLEVLAPARNWGMTRADSVDFAEKWEIPIKATKEKIYSIDRGISFIHSALSLVSTPRPVMATFSRCLPPISGTGVSASMLCCRPSVKGSRAAGNRTVAPASTCSVRLLTSSMGPLT